MSRNLVICCDGTSNEFGVENTNVVRLVQALDRHPDRQILYYDPGVGTMPEPGFFSRIGAKFSELMGLAVGWGLTRNVEEAYTYLMETWAPGDQVYLFGFSRGAYTVRVLAGLLHQLGLLPRGNQNFVPYVMKLFKAIRLVKSSNAGDGPSKYWELCDEFRYTFARPVPIPDTGSDQQTLRRERRFPVRFLGVWDTVSSVGWFWNPVTFRFTAHNPSIDVIRQAVAIDERRSFFRQNQIYPASAGQNHKEFWFPGVHADVGGGYPEAEGGLWRVPYQWMVTEAQAAGLLIDDVRLEQVLTRTTASPTPWNDDQHESLTWKWWGAEFIPKWHKPEGALLPVARFGLFRNRYVPKGSLIHQSTLRRIRETAYAPANFSTRFLKEVRDLTVLPESLPFEW